MPFLVSIITNIWLSNNEDCTALLVHENAIVEYAYKLIFFSHRPLFITKRWKVLRINPLWQNGLDLKTTFYGNFTKIINILAHRKKMRFLIMYDLSLTLKTYKSKMVFFFI
jgi:hypothetical protein